MSTTPPPPTRVRTPPAPFHGPRYDNWEPYSPRRSTRVSSMRMRRQSPDVAPGFSTMPLSSSSSASASTQQPDFSLASTPRKRSLKRSISSQTLSPPSSPEIEGRVAPLAHLSSVRRSLFTARHQSSPHHHASATPNRMANETSPEVMFPTPIKTPRKRGPSSPIPTARILNFKPGGLEDVMPTSSRKHKSRLTLFDEDAPQPEKISVFTDAQDRIPDVDHSDDNPFLGPRKQAVRSRSKRTLASPQHASEAEMEEAVRNNEGLIYVFRGKKMFRSFASSSPSNNGPEPEAREQGTLKRKAGVSAQRPLTRSLLEPRLLWPSKEQLREKETREAALDQDEEADTDIEQEHLPAPLPAARLNTITPAKKLGSQAAQVLTPPSSHRATRSAGKKPSFLSSLETMAETDEGEVAEAGTLASPSATPLPMQKAKRVSPFETWKRTKSSFSGSSSHATGKKRALSPQPDEMDPKRTRRAVMGGEKL